MDIILRWSKSRQSRSKFSRVQVPRLQGHPLCPVSAVEALFKAVPLTPSSPCFAYYHQRHLVPLTQVQVRLTLKQFCQSLNLPYQQLGFHGFRRSGVSFLYSHNIPLAQLKQHGTWSSDAICSYLTNSATVDCVPQAFASLLLSPCS